MHTLFKIILRVLRLFGIGVVVLVLVVSAIVLLTLVDSSPSTSTAAPTPVANAATAVPSTTPASSQFSLNFGEVVTLGNALFKSGQLEAARARAEEAIRQAPERFEGHALAALVATRSGDLATATNALARAIDLAPAEKRPTLLALREGLAAPAGATAPSTSLPPEIVRKQAALMLILEEADKAQTPEQRSKLLREFMNTATKLLSISPDLTNLWVVYAQVAVQTEQAHRAWIAGKRMKALGLEPSGDPTVQKAFALLERKEWLSPYLPSLTLNYTEINALRADAAIGDSYAQTLLGKVLDPNFKILFAFARTPNLQESREWLLKAANNGDAFAMGDLSDAYLAGSGVATDLAEAMRWNRRAAEAGNPGAQMFLGRSLHHGWNGLQINQDQAVGWYRKAASAGFPKAYGGLGDVHYGRKEMESAFQQFALGADAGDGYCAYSVGFLFEHGQGVAKNAAEALNWYRKSAERGDAAGQFAYGRTFEEGSLGQTKNREQAIQWYRKSEQQDNNDARKALVRLTDGGK